MMIPAVCHHTTCKWTGADVAIDSHGKGGDGEPDCHYDKESKSCLCVCEYGGKIPNGLPHRLRRRL
jgi:hypothetical protein